MSDKLWWAFRPGAWRWLPALALVVVLAGCEINRVVPGGPRDFYASTEVGAAWGGRDAWVKIDGNPFPIDQRSFETTVLDTLQKTWHRQPTHFTTTPDESANRNYKLVVVFNVAEAPSSQALCGEQPLETEPPQTDRILVRIAFCRHAGVVNDARGYIYHAESPTADGFRGILGDMMQAVFPHPLREPDNNNSSANTWISLGSSLNIGL